MNEISKAPHVRQNSGNNEWYTPEKYIKAARAVMGRIDLDPASCDAANEIVQAANYYTAEDDGLSYQWKGNIWLNPPYAAKLMPLFCSKLKSHADNGDVKEAIVLVNNATETAWFNTLIDVASAVIFPMRRIKFYTPSGKSGSPLQGQAVVYCGDNPHRFFEVFRDFGWGAVLK